ncbi:MAG: di-heme oxidoredictase family protein [Gammaproteobacteria bacterium]|nr:di-heme oxidoredictase family protein [Gammaproteobacteria bacterium]
MSVEVQAQPELDFYSGKALFEKNWIPAPASTTASDGLGPYYNARSCNQCHPDGGRGSKEQSLVVHSNDPVYGQQLQKFAIPGIPVEARVEFDADQEGGYQIIEMHYGDLENSVLSPRLAPSLHGLALLESIPESVITALADEEDSNADSISGRANLVADENGSFALGRFGWKAGQTSLVKQVARALSLDLGLGNPLQPSPYGDCTEAQSQCLATPDGNSAHHDDLEAGETVLSLLLSYISGLPEPSQENADHPTVRRGQKLFNQTGCADCHLPEIAFGGSVLQPYSDLLLHDMGPGLADELREGIAAGSEWRTPPLWGLGQQNGEYLHDGRADTLETAILWHDGEAAKAKRKYERLTEAQRSDVNTFLDSL